MTNQSTQAQPEALREFCRRHHIRRLALFGSVPRGDARPDSDLDVLVEFEPGHVPGLAFITMQDQLSALFGGRPVDLVTPKFLSPPSGSALAVLLSQASSFPAYATQALGLTAASATVAADAYREWREKRRAIEQNQLYFYYRAEKQLSRLEDPRR